MVTAMLFETIPSGFELSLKIYAKSRDSCNYDFCCYKRPRKLKTTNIYLHVFEVKSRIGDAKIFHFTVYSAEFKVQVHLNDPV